ncbi:hypothetical protein [Gluconobacter japonicus]|uniref:hypothetical protein n=1 Tax=Gluconobacter japonicus TaxID=376620 RepID=UPI000AEB99B1|nr:hypothetical protein [Gluconobacter japonicus]
MRGRTDTERLEWLWMNSDEAMSIIEHAENNRGHAFLSDATPLRTAIDAAMDAEERG